MLRPALALAAAVDIGDAFVLIRSIMRRERIDRAASLLLVSALAGAGTALAAYRATPNQDGPPALGPERTSGQDN